MSNFLFTSTYHYTYTLFQYCKRSKASAYCNEFDLIPLKENKGLNELQKRFSLLVNCSLVLKRHHGIKSSVNKILVAFMIHSTIELFHWMNSTMWKTKVQTRSLTGFGDFHWLLFVCLFVFSARFSMRFLAGNGPSAFTRLIQSFGWLVKDRNNVSNTSSALILWRYREWYS